MEPEHPNLTCLATLAIVAAGFITIAFPPLIVVWIIVLAAARNHGNGRSPS